MSSGLGFIGRWAGLIIQIYYRVIVGVNKEVMSWDL